MTHVEPSMWRDSVKDALAEGYTEFVTLFALDDEGVQVWLRLRSEHGADRTLRVAASAAIDTLIDLLPQAAWYEREAAEMFGITFTGHDTQHLLLAANASVSMHKAHLLPARQSTQWPGEKEPGGAVARRRQLPPGVRA